MSGTCCMRYWKTAGNRWPEHDPLCQRPVDASDEAWTAIQALHEYGWQHFAEACAIVGEQELRTQFYISRMRATKKAMK